MRRPDDEGWALEWVEPSGRRRVVVEDDGKVCYAYLCVAGRICADVWLYNVGESPEDVEIDRSKAPFRNPIRFCRTDVDLRFDASAARCLWEEEQVRLVVGDELWAELREGERPGRSILAASPSPFAHPLPKLGP